MQTRKSTGIGRATSYQAPLDRGSAPGATVTVALHQCMQRLRQSLDRQLASLSREITPDAVHRSRTAARRLRAVLRVFRRELFPAALRRYATALQELAHGLDAVRESDVTQHAISLLTEKHAGPGREELDGLKSLATQRRSRAVYDLESAIAVGPWAARLVKLRYVASDPRLIIESQEPIIETCVSA